MVIIAEGNRAKIHEAESTENTGRVGRIKSLNCDQNFGCSNIREYNEIIALTELRNKNILASRCCSLNTS